MRISDWSSDVCSSDLGTGKFEAGAAECLLHQRRTVDRISVIAAEFVIGTEHRQRLAQYYVADEAGAGAVGEFQMQLGYRDHRRDRWIGSRLQALAELQPRRSEEQTSELQSLMRITFAALCIEKKNRSHNTQ